MNLDWLTLVDLRVSDWFHSHATPMLTRWMLLVSHLHGTVAILAYVAIGATLLAWKRDWYWFASMTVTVPSGMLLNAFAKVVFHRARPNFDDAIVTLSTYGFPSGHVVGATLFHGVVAAILMTKVKEWPWRALALLCAVSLIVLVGLSRIYLLAHYFTDVIAGFVAALVWLTACLAGMRATSRWVSPRFESPHPG